jgi:hypothetical protein
LGAAHGAEAPQDGFPAATYRFKEAQLSGDFNILPLKEHDGCVSSASTLLAVYAVAIELKYGIRI